MTKTREASLRRIAIVLESLPDLVAQRLLGSLQIDSQRQVRIAIDSLADVDPLERRRALDGFATSLRHGQGRTNPSSDAAEVVFSRAAVRNLNERSDPAPQASSSPFGFLLDVEDETLVAHLSGELPQTLAIILASISPAQAARVLPRLDVAVRAEAMRRMANLHDVPGELVDEIGTQLRRHLVPSGGQAGKRALDAIMAEMQDDGQSKPSPSYPPSSNTRSDAAASAEPSSVEDGDERGPQSRRQRNVRLAEGTWPESDDENAITASSARASKQSSPLATTESVHVYLTSQSGQRLRDGLAQVTARQAMLALCGLPKATAESVLASLPRRQAKQVREQLKSLGSLELRDIDDAMRAVMECLVDEQAATGTAKIAVAA